VIPDPPETPAAILPEIKLRAEAIYRAQRARGSGAAKFRKDVQTAYRFRCAFCGLRAPTIMHSAKAGVDAAHILPWGNYDLDVVQNGLMLCKTHHWAFDNHVVKLHLTGTTYELELVGDWFITTGSDERTMEEFKRLAGAIPDAWLPVQKNLRPAKQYLETLYSV